MFRALAILGLITLLAVIILSRDTIERRRIDHGCRHEGFVAVETPDGYRCQDEHGTLFLPPFNPQRF